jgi:uncharacterized protein involved in response to NO
LKFSFVNAGLAGQHLLYIGGFALITLMIGTRVMLAHGGSDLTYEIRGSHISIAALFLSLAAGLRWYAGAFATSAWMIIAALLFIGAILLWLYKFYKCYPSNSKAP